LKIAEVRGAVAAVLLRKPMAWSDVVVEREDVLVWARPTTASTTR
jgi:hypothetical protein